MKRSVPGSIPTIGTLNIVFGSIFSFCCLSVVVFQVAGSGLFGNDMNNELLDEFLAREIPIYHVMKWGSLAVGVMCFLLMLISGIGLVSQAHWGRIVALTNAWIMILYFLTSGFYDLAIQAPAASRFIRDNPMLRNMVGLLWMQIILQLVVYILLLIYAIVTVCALMSSRVRDFFQGRSFDDQFYEDDWNDAPRSRGRRGWDEY